MEHSGGTYHWDKLHLVNKDILSKTTIEAGAYAGVHWDRLAGIDDIDPI